MSETPNTNTDTTEVVEVDMNLDALLSGTAGAGNVMTAAVGEKKPGVFTRPDADMKFLDNLEKDTPDPNETPDPDKPLAVDPTQTLNDLTDPDKKDTPDPNKKMNKATMVAAVSKLIEEGVIKPFDDDKPIDEYTVEDMQELIKVNISEKEREYREKTPVEFFDSLPQEMQFAAKYVMDGGTDLKGLFRALSSVEEVKELDPKADAAEITRRYLSVTQFGTPEEIEDEINAWKDRGELETKASKFKPKLDSMQQAQVARTLENQEAMRRKQTAQSQHYMQSVYDALEPGDLNGLPLDKKVQSMLYSGLVNPSYPSVSGRPTNLLGHLLEKHQFVEPNHALVAEALWLLQDPEGYRSKVREVGEKKATEKTVRMLKTEQADKKAGTNEDLDDNAQRKVKKPNTVARPGQGFFKR